jgi:hypothetical protein
MRVDGLTLLQQARAAGLTVTVEGDRLRIRGQRRADPIARQLIAHKGAVLEALAAGAVPGAAADLGPKERSGDGPAEGEDPRLTVPMMGDPVDTAPGTLVRPTGRVCGSEATSALPGPDWSAWRAVEWPQRCLESERRFGQPCARLYPLIPCGNYPGAPTGRVMTARGPGRLLAVFADVVQVALDDDPKSKAAILQPWEVWPNEES